MTRPAQEQLIGYLLGALDQHEHDSIERELQTNPELRQHVTALASLLKPLDYDRDHTDYDPPAGLAGRTCAWLSTQVTEVIKVSSPDQAATVMLAKRMSDTREFHGRRGFSVADIVVTAGIFLAASVLFFPALANSRNQAHIISCQNNLRQLGLALAGYSDVKGTVPQIPESGNRSVAGIYAPVLYNEGNGWFVDPRILVCPSTRFGKKEGEWRGVPSLEQVDRAQGEELAVLQRTMGGSYGYNLGYQVNGKYSAPKKRQSPEFALMADTPSANVTTGRSENHGGRGHNVLFADSHIQYLMDCMAGRCDDDLFRNRLNRIEAGVDDQDTVIGRSDASPFGKK